MNIDRFRSRQRARAVAVMAIRLIALLAASAGAVQDALAVPPGYRYVGSRIVSEGRHVLWYWNADYYRTMPDSAGFVAQMWARNVELGEERGFDAIVRCDLQSYTRVGSGDPPAMIEPGDPIGEVLRAGCSEGRAVSKTMRLARMNGSDPLPESVASLAEQRELAASTPLPPTSAPTAASAMTLSPTPTPTRAQVGASAPPAPSARAPSPPPAPTTRPADSRADARVDRCIRFANAEASMFGDATVTNTCAFDVQVVFCYKGGAGQHFDCPAPPSGMGADSLAPGKTHRLPEYRRDRNRGIVLVACKGAIGAIVPLLNDNGGKTGCF